MLFWQKEARPKIITPRRQKLPESYEFTSNTDPLQVNTSFSFETSSGNRYSIIFIEAIKVMDFLDDFPGLSNAIYVIVDNTFQNGNLGFDARIGITIITIIKHYLEEVDLNSILVFDCFVEDEKQIQRHNKFDRWYRQYAMDMEFVKLDEEIIAPQGSIYVPTFISILYRMAHPRKEYIPLELGKLRQLMKAAK